MTKGFDFGDALGAGFGLIRRHPLAVLVWGVVLTVVYLPMIPLYASMFEIMERMEASGDTAAMPSEMMTLNAVSAPLTVLQLLTALVVITAIFRAVLARGVRDRFAFLRLGMDELRVAVSYIAVVAGLYAVMALVVVLAFLLGAVAVAAEQAVLWIPVVLVVLAGTAAVVWGLLRTSLIAPACMIYGDFAFVQGWRLARGRLWALFGLGLALWAMAMLVYLILVIVALVVALPLMAAGGGSFDPEVFAAMRPDWPVVWAWVAVGFLPVAAVYGAVSAIFYAPFADAARQLADTLAAETARPADALDPPSDTPFPDPAA